MGSSNGTISISNTLNSSLNCSLLYENDRLPLLVLYGVVFTVGVPANLITMYLTFLEVRRKNVLGLYLLSLSVCDLMYLSTLPAWAIYIQHGHHWYFGSLACKITGYIFFNNMYVSIFLLCCVSVDRYIAVVHSLKSRGLRQRKLAAVVIIVIVVIVALVHMPVFTMAEGETDGEMEKRCFEPGQKTATLTAFNYARFIVGFFIPLCILMVTNRGIFSVVWDSDSLSSEQKFKVIYLVLAVILFFLICFAPYHIILLLRAISFHFSDSQCTMETTLYLPYSISLGLSTLNSAMNPILYVLASDNMRREICESICCLCIGRFLSRYETTSAMSSQAAENRNCPESRSNKRSQDSSVIH